MKFLVLSVLVTVAAARPDVSLGYQYKPPSSDFGGVQFAAPAAQQSVPASSYGVPIGAVTGPTAAPGSTPAPAYNAGGRVITIDYNVQQPGYQQVQQSGFAQQDQQSGFQQVQQPGFGHQVQSGFAQQVQQPGLGHQVQSGFAQQVQQTESVTPTAPTVTYSVPIHGAVPFQSVYSPGFPPVSFDVRSHVPQYSNIPVSSDASQLGFASGFSAGVSSGSSLPSSVSFGSGVSSGFESSVTSDSAGSAGLSSGSGSESSVSSDSGVSSGSVSQVSGGSAASARFGGSGQVEVQKSLYFFSAPEEPELPAPKVILPQVQAKKNVRIIFIKAPTYKTPAVHIPAISQNEEKTLVYVLVKRPEAGEVVVDSSSRSQPSKPEVYFIKYKTKQEAEEAVQQLQSGNAAGNLQIVANPEGDDASFLNTISDTDDVQNSFVRFGGNADGSLGGLGGYQEFSGSLGGQYQSGGFSARSGVSSGSASGSSGSSSGSADEAQAVVIGGGSSSSGSASGSSSSSVSGSSSGGSSVSDSDSDSDEDSSEEQGSSGGSSASNAEQSDAEVTTVSAENSSEQSSLFVSAGAQGGSEGVQSRSGDQPHLVYGPPTFGH